MTITALIPAHNEESSLAATIGSLYSQTLPPDRIIVISDNSTDRTAQVAQEAGAEVLHTRDNPHRKAGALNQAIASMSPAPYELILILDADTQIAPTFIQEGVDLLKASPHVGAVGGVFIGQTPRGYLQWCQANEYDRYGLHIELTNRTSVLTGTAALIRRSALETVAQSRGTVLPGERGDYYDRHAITEDSELTLALKTLGFQLRSPRSMTCTTELMPTWGDLHRQRLRWYKGMLDNLRTYGLTRTTARYFGQQTMLVVGTVMMAAFLTLTAVTIAAGTFTVVPVWMAIGGIFLVEKVITISTRTGRGLAALVFPELLYDLVLQAAFVRAAWLAAFRREVVWNHLTPGGN